jgi:hypothetical protein
MAALTPTPAALRTLARSLVRELHKRGYGVHHVVGLADELLDRACDSFTRRG